METEKKSKTITFEEIKSDDEPVNLDADDESSEEEEQEKFMTPGEKMFIEEKQKAAIEAEFKINTDARLETLFQSAKQTELSGETKAFNANEMDLF